MQGFLVIPYFLIMEIGLNMTDALIISIVYSLKKSFKTAMISNRKLANKIGIDRRTVINSLNRLEASGLITRFYNKDGRRVIELSDTILKRMEETTEKANRGAKASAGKKDTNVNWFKDYLKDA